MTVFDRYLNRYSTAREEEMTVQEYLELCKKDSSAYASVAERMLAAIGEPTVVDTHLTDRNSRIFANKMIRIYPAFKGFYGMEEVIESIVAYFRHAAQGLEEKKQILYLLGPVGGGKSSLAEMLKHLMQKVPFYAIKGSPVNESPLGLFNPVEDGRILEDDYGIPRRYLNTIMSPWAVKRLHEYGGRHHQVQGGQAATPPSWPRSAIAKTEPGDENNQDISSLVGKIDIRKLETYSQNDPDAYSLLGRPVPGQPGHAGVRGDVQGAHQGAAPPADRHPGRQLQGHGGIRRHPVRRADPGPLQRGGVADLQEQPQQRGVPGPHLHRQGAVLPAGVGRGADLPEAAGQLLASPQAPCAPDTLKMLAQFSVLSRLKEPENSSIYSKMRIYDGENLKDTDPKAKSYQEYRDYAGVDEGMTGLSTRFAFKILSKVFNYDHREVAANPVHLMYVLEQQIEQEQFPPATEEQYRRYLKEYLSPRYAEFIGKEIQTAYLESYSEYGQNIFDRYVTYADFWIQDQEFRDPNTGEMLDRAALNDELEKIEKPAGISNPKDFRNEVVNFVLRARAKQRGQEPLLDLATRSCGR